MRLGLLLFFWGGGAASRALLSRLLIFFFRITLHNELITARQRLPLVKFSVSGLISLGLKGLANKSGCFSLDSTTFSCAPMRLLLSHGHVYIQWL